MRRQVGTDNVLEERSCKEKTPIEIGKTPAKLKRVHFEKEESPVRHDAFKGVAVRREVPPVRKESEMI